MAYLYVMFSETATAMGKTIRLVTHNTYNHVCVSADEYMNKMYSFARRTRCSPFAGGFVVETPSRYLCEKKPAQVKICRVEVPQEQFDGFTRTASFMERHPGPYIYNSFGAVHSLIGKNLPIRDSYTCLEFSAQILKFNNIYSIKQLENLLKDDIIYCGSYIDYLKRNGIVPEIDFNDSYFNKYGTFKIYRETLMHFYTLFKRL